VIRHAKRLYTRMGFAERVDILENDAKHNYDRLQREGIARWMSRWLRGKDEPLVEPEIELITDQEAQCTPTGQVMDLPGARSIYDLHEIYNAELAKRRAALWAGEDRAKRLEQVRRTAVIRKLDELPAPRVVKGETIRRDGYRIEKLDLLPEEGIVLPAMLFKPEKPGDGRTIIYVHEKGVEADAAPGGPIEKLALSGARVLAVELRGTGASQRVARENWHHVGPDWDYVSTALLLGKTYVGMRAEDILTAARYAARELAGKENSGGLSPFSSDENRTVPFGSGGSPVGVELMPVGHVGVPSLHAAALEPELFDRVKLSQTLVSSTSLLEARLFYNQYVNVVHGALLEYDLPDLAAALGEKLLIEDPRDGAGKPIVQ